MTAQELNTYIDKVLGNCLRCLLPSYWWKRLLTQIVDYVDGVDTKFDNKVKTLDNKINTNVSNLETEKQDVLISGTSIKTINGVSILGSGDIEIQSESGGITSETDPIFLASPSSKITEEDIENWRNNWQLTNDSNYIVDYSMFPDGIYAVTSNLNLVTKEIADESCIGVAFIQGEHRYMISKYDSEQASWSYNLYGTDIPNIINYATTTEAESDFNGKENTEAIQRAYSTYNKTMLETDMCYILNTFNIKSESQLFDDWYIPAYGQLHIMLPFIQELNDLFEKINGTTLQKFYWTSSERDSYSGYVYQSFIQGMASNTKKYQQYVRFIRDLRSIKEELDQQKPLITLSSNKVHLLPNKYYRVNTTHYSSLTITLEPESKSDILNEYFIEFAIGSSNITISLPTNIKWVNGETPQFFTNTTYQISIVNNLGIVTSFK